MVKLLADKGVGTEYPENTLPAFKAAVFQGYSIIGTDISVTKDGLYTAVNENLSDAVHGYSEIPQGTRVSSLTYKELCEYDFGIGFARKFEGTEPPLLDEVLDLARKNGIKVRINADLTEYPGSTQKNLLNHIRTFGDHIIFTCKTAESADSLLKEIPQGEIYFGISDKNDLKKFLSETHAFSNREKLIIGIPYAIADKKLCGLIKNTAKLSINAISDYPRDRYDGGDTPGGSYDNYNTAVTLFGADIIETSGQIKPELNFGILADLHTHTENSHDCECKITDLCDAELASGVNIIAVTDHCDGLDHDEAELSLSVSASLSDIANANKIYLGKPEVLKGIEIGEEFRYSPERRKSLKKFSFDVILGSVHSVRCKKHPGYFADTDFSAFTYEEISEYLDRYFDDIYDNLLNSDFDILTHLTNPLKYITGKYGITVDLSVYCKKIDLILKYIISHGIALEINTSSVCTALEDYMPGKDIIRRYRALGGYLITLGSDSHRADRAAADFTAAVEFLKETGFRNIFYYKNRKSIQITI